MFLTVFSSFRELSRCEPYDRFSREKGGSPKHLVFLVRFAEGDG